MPKAETLLWLAVIVLLVWSVWRDVRPVIFDALEEHKIIAGPATPYFSTVQTSKVERQIYRIDYYVPITNVAKSGATITNIRGSLETAFRSLPVSFKSPDGPQEIDIASGETAKLYVGFMYSHQPFGALGELVSSNAEEKEIHGFLENSKAGQVMFYAGGVCFCTNLSGEPHATKDYWFALQVVGNEMKSKIFSFRVRSGEKGPELAIKDQIGEFVDTRLILESAKKRPH